VVGFGQVGEFEVGAEGLDDVVGVGDGHAAHQFDHARDEPAFFGGIGGVLARVVELAQPDRQVAQLFFGLVHRHPGLLADHDAQKHAQGAHVVLERPIFHCRIAADQFLEPRPLILDHPEEFPL